MPSRSWWLDQRVRASGVKPLLSGGDRLLEPHRLPNRHRPRHIALAATVPVHLPVVPQAERLPGTPQVILGTTAKASRKLRPVKIPTEVADSGDHRNSSGPICSIGLRNPSRLRGRSLISVVTAGWPGTGSGLAVTIRIRELASSSRPIERRVLLCSARSAPTSQITAAGREDRDDSGASADLLVERLLASGAPPLRRTVDERVSDPF
jgi:hypothetical protein